MLKGITFCNLASVKSAKKIMKIILKLLLAINGAGLLFGYYIKSSNPLRGDFYIGLSVLMLAFILLPTRWVQLNYLSFDIINWSIKDKFINELNQS